MLNKLFCALLLTFPLGNFAQLTVNNYIASDNYVNLNFYNNLYIEPRFSSAEFKQSSNVQDGSLWGFKGGYNFISPCLPYFGIEGAYMRGNLKGDVKQDKVKSQYQDWWIEGKVGYPFVLTSLMFAPFVGIGYENEKNDYVSPTPCTPKNNYYYGFFSLGFLSEWYYFPCLSLGCSFEVKYPFAGHYNGHYQAEEKVKHSCSISHNLHYNIDFPLALYPSPYFSIALVPFYEYRNYCLNIAKSDSIKKSSLSQFGLGLRLNYQF